MISPYIDVAVICNHTDMACALLENTADDRIEQYMVMAMFTFLCIVYNDNIHLACYYYDGESICSI